MVPVVPTAGPGAFPLPGVAVAGSPMLEPETAVQFLKGVGPDRARLLAKMGIATVGDLVRHLPRSHQDRRHITPIGELRPETRVVVRGRVASVRTREVGGGRGGGQSVVTAVIEDDTGSLGVEFWGQRFRARQLQQAGEVILAGRVTLDLQGPRMQGPELETALADDEGVALHADRLVPVHPVTKGLHAATLRAMIWRALEAVADRIPDPVPPEVAARRVLMPLADALRQVHFPDDVDRLAQAKRRLKFEECFVLECALALRRRRAVREAKPHRIVVTDKLHERVRARLPFQLTGAQERVVAEILADLSSPFPMNRLLQGDVGSGKTVVALYGMLAVVASRLQAALLAPTEILAEQHHATLSRLLGDSRVQVGLLTGRAGAAARRATLEATAAGEIDILVGTHALVQEGVEFRDLALVVVDEQHKFGVLQREALRDKGLCPDLLVMSATPIPRTLTMTVYGDLDVSLLDELPPGRQPVETVLCREGDRAAAYAWVRAEIARGRRVYHVVPLVDENEELPLKSAVAHAEELQRTVFPDLSVGLLHGRMKPAEKDLAMERFRSGESPVLVATSVVEVGVDVPQATVLVIEDAERFGLAQLHQLRGRIGRGSHPSRVYCFHDARTRSARERLRAFRSTTDGFLIAEADLRIRGPGEFLGTRQSGLPDLVVTDLVHDAPLLVQAREDAFALVDADPTLEGAAAPLRDALVRRWGRRVLLPPA